jgi:hypothetical protein
VASEKLFGDFCTVGGSLRLRMLNEKQSFDLFRMVSGDFGWATFRGQLHQWRIAFSREASLHGKLAALAGFARAVQMVRVDV